MDAEVAVIGLGTMGSMVTWQLAKKGVSVLGFEQFGVGHDRSAHGGGSRRFGVVTFVPEEIEYKYDAHYYFRDLERETGQSLLTHGGTLTIGHPDSDRMKRTLDAINKYELPHRIYETKEAEKRFPMHKLYPGEIVVYDELGGVLRPEQTIISAVNRAKVLGAQTKTHTEVTNIEPDSNGVTIETADGETYRVGKVVITTGPWGDKLYPKVKDVFTVQRRLMTWFIPETPKYFTEEYFPNFGRTTDGTSLVGAPAMDGRLVRINDRTVSDEYVQSVEMESADDLVKNVSMKELASVRETVKRFLPNLNPDPVQALAFMEGFTKDGLPLVGNTKDHENVYLAIGFSARGFSQAPTIGAIVSDLVTKDSTKYQIDHILPDRYGI